MARKKSTYLSAFGTAFEIFKAITDEVIALGGGDEDVARLINNQKIRRAVAEAIMAGKQMLAGAFRVTVNYGLTLEAAIAEGRYDWKNSDITPGHFPETRTDTVEADLVLVHLNRVATTQEVEAELEARGLRAADIRELLAFGAKNPEEQRKYPIVALRSVWRFGFGNRGCAYLGEGDSKRSLSLGSCYPGSQWREDCRFLAARKK